MAFTQNNLYSPPGQLRKAALGPGKPTDRARQHIHQAAQQAARAAGGRAVQPVPAAHPEAELVSRHHLQQLRGADPLPVPPHLADKVVGGRIAVRRIARRQGHPRGRKVGVNRLLGARLGGFHGGRGVWVCLGLRGEHQTHVAEVVLNGGSLH
jgi:hypothetical protein